ncbi:unnamed protein product [Amoebophrya sp. A120]|nr:unnamed protein product [Amoebophrya sp. A120]|eukprot:GSA120T00004844001.1
MGVVAEQLATLLYKDLILRRRAPFETFCLCLCPCLTIILACSSFIFIEDLPHVVPFTTEENAAQAPVGPSSTFLFDPFPLDCVAVDAVSLLARGDIDTEGNGGGPIQEVSIGLKYTTNFDCFLGAIASYIPLWNIMVRQLRERPSWVPTPRTFAVIDETPVPHGGTVTRGTSFANYMEKRYNQNIALVMVFYNLTDSCFRNEQLHYVDKNLSPYDVVPVFGSSASGSSSTSPFASLFAANATRRQLTVSESGDQFGTRGEEQMGTESSLNYFERRDDIRELAVPPGSTVDVSSFSGHVTDFPVSNIYQDCITNRPMECFNACFFQDNSFRTNAIAEIQQAMSGSSVVASTSSSRRNLVAGEEDVSEDVVDFMKNIESEYRKNQQTMALEKKQKEEEKRHELLQQIDGNQCADHDQLWFPRKNPFDLEALAEFLEQTAKAVVDEAPEDAGFFFQGRLKQGTETSRVVSNKRTLQSSSTTSSGNSGNTEQVDCRSLTSPCECARHRTSHGCQWRQESRLLHGMGRCRAGNSRRSDTSCAECSNQEGCLAVDLWERLGASLPRLSPAVRQFGAESDLEDFIAKVNYPGERTEQWTNGVNGLLEDVIVSDSICAAVVFADNGNRAVIRPNATSSAGVQYGLDTYRSVSLRSRPGSMQAYQLSGFIGSQAVLNDFLQCRNAVDISDCLPASRQIAQQVQQQQMSVGTTVTAQPEPTKNYASQNVSLISMGSPAHQRNPVLQYSGWRLWSQMWISFCFPVLTVAGKILREKESKIRDGMRMMGLRDAAFYLEDFVFNAMLAFPIALCAVIALSNMPHIVIYSDPFFLFLVFFFCLWHTLSFAVFLTSFFSSSLFGKIVCFGMVFMSRLFLELTDGGWTTSQIRALGLFFPSCAFKYEMITWYNLEIKTDGLTAATITWRNDNFSAQDGLIVHIIGIFMYTLFFAYFDQVIPTEFGVPQPWYFPLSKVWWQQTVFATFKGSNTKEEQTSAAGEVEEEELADATTMDRDPTCFEKKTEQQRDAERRGECVQVKKLRKEFFVDGQKIVAVDNFSTTVYKNEIYVLLGHNGAGKTTTFSMLTGLIPTTGGTSSFFGNSMQYHLTNCRSKVGMCPQFSVLWPQVTALEHLVLFAMWKGVSRADAYREAEELLREQNMDHKKDALARTLSGGMRRKLSLAIAFTGNPELVFLDEPSSGLDSSARREIWNLLRTRKDNRVIILTTHYMDEADALGDRIAIMSQGRIKCCGSPNFLKNVYGCGYNLSFTLTESAVVRNSGASLFFFLQEVLKPFHVKLLSVAGKDLLFLVPFEASACFEKAFDRVEKYQQALKIKSWNLYVCNLEEVFLKIASDEEVLRAKTASTVNPSILDMGTNNTARTAPFDDDDEHARLTEKTAISEDVEGTRHQTAVNEHFDLHLSAGAHAADHHLASVVKGSSEVASRQNSKETIEKIVNGTMLGGAGGRDSFGTVASQERYSEIVKALEEGGASSGEEQNFAGTRSGAGVVVTPVGVDDPSAVHTSTSDGVVSACQAEDLADHERVPTPPEKKSPFTSDQVLPEVLGVPTSGGGGKDKFSAATGGMKHGTLTHGGDSMLQYTNAGFSRQMQALLWKRYLNSKRDFWTTLVQQTCPVLLTSLSIIFLILNLKDLPYRQLTYENDYNTDMEAPANRYIVPVSFSSDDVEQNDYQSGIPPKVYTTQKPALALWPENQPCSTKGGCQQISSGLSTSALLSATDNSVSQSENTAFVIAGSQCPTTQQGVYSGVLDFVFSAFQNQVNPLLGGGFGGAAVTADATATTMLNTTATVTAAPLVFATTSGSFSTSSLATSRIPTAEQKNSSIRFVYALEDQIQYRKPDESAYGGVLLADNRNVLLHVNHTGYHAAPIMLQYFYNYVASTVYVKDPATGVEQTLHHGMTDLGVHPLPQTADEKDFRLRFQSFAIAFNVMISFAFVSCFSLVFVVMEKESEIKAQQFINGVDIPTYWLAQYVYDFCTFLFPIMSLLIVLPFLEVWSLVGADTLPVFLMLMLLFALAIPSFFYICAHGFRTANSAMTTALVMNLLVATVLFIVTFVFELMPFVITRKVGYYMSALSRIWPVFTFGEGVRRMAMVSFIWTQNPPDTMTDSYYSDCEEKYDRFEIGAHWCSQSMWDKFAAGQALTILGLQAVFYITIAIIIDLLQEDVRFRQIFFEPKFDPSVNKTAEIRALRDQDVVDEENRVHGMLAQGQGGHMMTPMTSTGGDPEQDRDHPGHRQQVDHDQTADDPTTRTTSSHNHRPGQVASLPQIIDPEQKVSIFFKNVSKLFKVSTKSTVMGAPVVASETGSGQGVTLTGAPEFKDTSFTTFVKERCCCCCPCFRKKTEVRDVHAVRDCSFALHKGDVFGLLGANGAGKTTTFRMMCGVTVPAKDPDTDIRILGKDIFTQRAECRQLIGYTAQANPLWMGMTVREHLEFYAMIKGIPPHELALVVEKQMQDLDLLSYVTKRATNLSGGNKRKLVIAMSLIGAPPVLFLDEPSAGMDPAARRKMWSILHYIATKRKRSTVILTSHSMDEVEALCSKLCIMTNGVFRCMGSLSRIKELYGKGFDLYAKFEEPEDVRIKAVVREHLMTTAMINSTVSTATLDDQQLATKTVSLEEAQQILLAVEDVLKLTTSTEAGDAMKQEHTTSTSYVTSVKQQLQQMLVEKNSPFPHASRLWSKEVKSKDDLKRIKEDRVRLLALGEWFLFACWRIRFASFVQERFAHAQILEQRQNVLLFRIDATDSRRVLDSTKKEDDIGDHGSGVPPVDENATTTAIPHVAVDDHEDAASRITNPDEARGASTSGTSFLGPLFGLLEKHKSEFHIMEYAVTPTTLEQIFNQFTLAQVGEDDTL